MPQIEVNPGGHVRRPSAACRGARVGGSGRWQCSLTASAGASASLTTSRRPRASTIPSCASQKKLQSATGVQLSSRGRGVRRGQEPAGEGEELALRRRDEEQKRWQARRARKHRGTYVSVEETARSYDAAAPTYRGSAATLSLGEGPSAAPTEAALATRSRRHRERAELHGVQKTPPSPARSPSGRRARRSGRPLALPGGRPAAPKRPAPPPPEMPSPAKRGRGDGQGARGGPAAGYRELLLPDYLVQGCSGKDPARRLVRRSGE